jgi:hypothetical protein
MEATACRKCPRCLSNLEEIKRLTGLVSPDSLTEFSMRISTHFNSGLIVRA